MKTYLRYDCIARGPPKGSCVRSGGIMDAQTFDGKYLPPSRSGLIWSIERD